MKKTLKNLLAYVLAAAVFISYCYGFSKIIRDDVEYKTRDVFFAAVMPVYPLFVGGKGLINKIVSTSKKTPSKNNHKLEAEEVNQIVPEVLNSEIIDKYVSEINKRAPILGDDSVTILGAKRDKIKIIYKMTAPFVSSSEEVDLMNSSGFAKKILCYQEAEKFFLSKGFSLEWIYYNSRNEYLGKMTVNPEDC